VNERKHDYSISLEDGIMDDIFCPAYHEEYHVSNGVQTAQTCCLKLVRACLEARCSNGPLDSRGGVPLATIRILQGLQSLSEWSKVTNVWTRETWRNVIDHSLLTRSHTDVSLDPGAN